ncbi:putative uncharacterized protein [Waddlia chondrophila 2032/99]|nr:putative uncharacterized protein [Waddlia chondrophila 2032/99]
MNLQSDYSDYLSGAKFHNGLNVQISNRHELKDRLCKIEELVQNKNVLHAGCVDHLPLIKEKIHSNRWLHKRLSLCASRCMGFDIDQPGIEFVKKLGYSNVIYHDLIKDKILPKEICEFEWDYMVLGELLEHINNPVLFLEELKNKYQAKVSKVIITVPNAFRISNFKFSLFNKELINSDHRYWFTPYTLAKIIVESGLIMEDMHFVEGCLSRKSFFKNFLLKRKPLFCDTIVAIASL